MRKLSSDTFDQALADQLIGGFVMTEGNSNWRGPIARTKRIVGMDGVPVWYLVIERINSVLETLIAVDEVIALAEKATPEPLSPTELEEYLGILPPFPPVTLVADQDHGYTKFTFSWTDVQPPRAVELMTPWTTGTTYLVFYRPQASETWYELKPQAQAEPGRAHLQGLPVSVSNGPKTVSVVGLVPGTAYEFAFCYRQEQSGRVTQGPGRHVTGLTSNLPAIAELELASLSAMDPGDPRISPYTALKLYWANPGGVLPGVPLKVVVQDLEGLPLGLADLTATTFTVTGLTPGTSHKFRAGIQLDVGVELAATGLPPSQGALLVETNEETTDQLPQVVSLSAAKYAGPYPSNPHPGNTLTPYKAIVVNWTNVALNARTSGLTIKVDLLRSEQDITPELTREVGRTTTSQTLTTTSGATSWAVAVSYVIPGTSFEGPRQVVNVTLDPAPGSITQMPNLAVSPHGHDEVWATKLPSSEPAHYRLAWGIRKTGGPVDLQYTSHAPSAQVERKFTGLSGSTSYTVDACWYFNDPWLGPVEGPKNQWSVSTQAVPVPALDMQVAKGIDRVTFTTFSGWPAGGLNVTVEIEWPGRDKYQIASRLVTPGGDIEITGLAAGQSYRFTYRYQVPGGNTGSNHTYTTVFAPPAPTGIQAAPVQSGSWYADTQLYVSASIYSDGDDRLNRTRIRFGCASNGQSVYDAITSGELRNNGETYYRRRYNQGTMGGARVRGATFTGLRPEETYTFVVRAEAQNYYNSSEVAVGSYSSTTTKAVPASPTLNYKPASGNNTQEYQWDADRNWRAYRDNGTWVHPNGTGDNKYTYSTGWPWEVAPHINELYTKGILSTKEIYFDATEWKATDPTKLKAGANVYSIGLGVGRMNKLVPHSAGYPKHSVLYVYTQAAW